MLVPHEAVQTIDGPQNHLRLLMILCKSADNSISIENCSRLYQKDFGNCFCAPMICCPYSYISRILGYGWSHFCHRNLLHHITFVMNLIVIVPKAVTVLIVYNSFKLFHCHFEMYLDIFHDSSKGNL